MQIRPVEGAQEDARLTIEQPGDDVGARRRVGRGGHGKNPHVADGRGRRAQTEIVGAEVMPPLRHAMRFVNGDAARPRLAQERLGVRPREALGRDIEQREPALAQQPQHGGVLLAVVGGIERAGPHPERAQLLHLIAHQGDERRDHQRQPAIDERGKLIAQALARARGHDGQHILAGEDRREDFGLSRPEIGIAVDARQNAPRLIKHVGHCLLRDVRRRTTGCARAPASRPRRHKRRARRN
jgi:hypothetical protein